MTCIDILRNIQETELVVSRILDGDSISVIGVCTHEEKESRQYGLDAPETRNSRKLREDEEKTRVSGEMPRFMGNH
jgi:endonuclease YncB( thermonuclease family)